MKQKYWTESATKLILTLVLVLPLGCQAQEGKMTKGTQDTIYVLYERTGNKVIEVGRRVYHRPDAAYPKDISRDYIIKMAKLCVECPQTRRIENHSIMLSFDAQRDTTFFLSKRTFYQTDYKDQDWFNDQPIDTIQKLMSSAKVIYLVDEGYLSDGQFIVLKVSYDDFTID